MRRFSDAPVAAIFDDYDRTPAEGSDPSVA
jgi:hypothetical protein